MQLTRANGATLAPITRPQFQRVWWDLGLAGTTLARVTFERETDATVARSEGHAAIVESGSFTGVQFHPEKSGRAGVRFLESCLSRV